MRGIPRGGRKGATSDFAVRVGHRTTAVGANTFIMEPVKVFIVDDSTHLCEMLSELIEDPGNVTVCGTADNARRAVDDIRRMDPDIVIADLQLREGSGFDVITVCAHSIPAVRSELRAPRR